MGADAGLEQQLETARQNMASLPDLTAMYNDRSAVKDYVVLPSYMSSDASGGAYSHDDDTMYFHQRTIEDSTEQFTNISNHEHIHSQQTDLRVEPSRISVEDYMRHAIGNEAGAFTGQYDAAFRKSLQGEPQYLQRMRDEYNFPEVGEKYDAIMQQHFPDGDIDINSPAFEQARQEAMGAAYSAFYTIDDNPYNRQAYSEYLTSTIQIGTDIDEKSLSLMDERRNLFHLKDKVEDKDLTSQDLAQSMRLGDTDYSAYVDQKLFTDDAYFRQKMEATGATEDSFQEFRERLERLAPIKPDIKNSSIWQDLQDNKFESVSFEKLDGALQQYQEDKTPPAESLGLTIVTPEQRNAYVNADPMIRSHFNIVEFATIQQSDNPNLAQDYIAYAEKSDPLEHESTFDLKRYESIAAFVGKDTLHDYLDMRQHMQNAGLGKEDYPLSVLVFAELKNDGADINPDKMLRNMSPALSDITDKTQSYNPLLTYEIARGQDNATLVSALDGFYEKSATRLNGSEDSYQSMQDYKDVSRAIDNAVLRGDTSSLKEVIEDSNNQFAQDAKDELNVIYTQVNTDFTPEQAMSTELNTAHTYS